MDWAGNQAGPTAPRPHVMTPGHVTRCDALYKLEVVARHIEGLVLGLHGRVVQAVDLCPVDLSGPAQPEAPPPHQIHQVLYNAATVGGAEG